MKNFQEKPQGIRPKRILMIGPNTKESIFDSRWVTAHQGSHWWASRLNAHGHHASTYDMNLQPGEIAEDPNYPHLLIEDLFKRGMPGYVHNFKANGNHGSEDIGSKWYPYTDLLELFTTQRRSISDPDIIWKPWDIIGFSVLDATIEYDIAKIAKARQLSPNALLVGGGSQSTLNYQTLFDKSPLDMVVMGQDPFALLRIANEEAMSLFEPKSASGIVMRNHARPVTQEEWTEWIGELDFKAMHQDLYWKKTSCLYENPQFQDINTFRLFMHNFCPVNCAFCTLTGLQRAATGKPTKAVGLSGNNIVKTIQRVMEHYPTTHQIFFCDDDFMLTPQWSNDFCDSMIEAKAQGLIPEKLGFICLTNINRLDEKMIAKAVKAGFRVLSIGVESVSQWKLNSMNKPQTPEKIWKVTKMILDSGIKPYYTLLLFTPFERIEDMVVDINGFRKMSEMGVGLSIEPYLMPLHGTIFYEADVPTRYKIIPIEGSRETVKKGTAWMMVRPDSQAVFLEFEKWFPRFKKWRYSSDENVKHKEKNYYSHVILDAQEFVLRKYFPHLLKELYDRTGFAIDKPAFKTQAEVEEVSRQLCGMDNLDVDSVGSVIKRKARFDMSSVDFSGGRVNIQELQRRVALETEEEYIASVDMADTLKGKSKKDAHVQESFH